MTGKRKIQYVNNHDLVREINASKMSYCSMVDVKYMGYDHIVKKLVKINDKKSIYVTPEISEIIIDIENNIDIAKQRRLKRINSVMLKDVQKATGVSPKNAEAIIGDRLLSIDDISESDLVFRVICIQHIPEECMLPDGRLNNNMLHFVPFKHYQLIDGKLIEVVRSHWQGTIEDGTFNSEHGSLTRTLSRMIIMLADKYSKKSNFRGYSYRDEMVSNALVHLSKSSLLFDEAKVGDNLNPFAYLTQICSNAFKAVLNTEKKCRDLRDDLLIEHGLAASSTRMLEIEMQSKTKSQS